MVQPSGSVRHVGRGAGIRRRITLLLGSAAFVGQCQPAQAQELPSNWTSPTVAPTIKVDGTPLPSATPGPTTGALMTVDLNTSATIIDWQTFNVGLGGTVQFSSGLGGNISVLNRVSAGNPSTIAGTMQGNGISVWLSNPDGITFGGTGTFSGGALVLTTAALTNGDFTNDNVFTFAGAAPNRAITLTGLSQITADNLVVAGQQISTSGTITTLNGQTALVAARDMVLNFTPGSPLGITVTTGTEVASGTVIGGTIQAGSIKVAGAGANGNALLISVPGQLTASAINGKIILATKTASDVTVSAVSGQPDSVTLAPGGTLTTSSAGGDVLVATTGSAILQGDVIAARDLQIDADADGLVTTAAAGQDIIITADQVARVQRSVTAGRDLLVTGGTGVVLGDGSASTQNAGRFATVQATTGNVQGLGGVTLQSDSNGSGLLGASDTLSVRALTGNILLGNTQLIAGLTGVPGFGGQSDVFVDAAQSVELASVDGRSIGVRGTAGPVSTGALTALEDIAVRAGGTLAVDSARAGDDIDLTSVDLLTLAGTALTTATGADSSNVDLSGGSIAIFPFELADHVGANIRLTSTVGNVTAGTLDALAGNDVLVDSVIADAGVTLARAGRDVSVHGGGSAALGTGAATAGDITVDADTLDASLGTGAGGRDILINADLGNATAGTLGVLTSGRDFTTTSAQLASVLHDVTASRDYLVTGGTGVVLGDNQARTQKAARFTTIVATTGNVAQGAGLLTLQSDSDGTGTRGASDTLSVRAPSGNVLLTNSALLGGPAGQSDVLVGSAQSVALGSMNGRSIGIRGVAGSVTTGALVALEDIGVRAGTTLGSTSANAGDDIDLTSVGALTLTTGLTSGVGANASFVDLSSAQPAIGTPELADHTGADIRLTSTAGNVTAGTLDALAGRDVLVDAVLSNADVTLARAGRDVNVHGGGSAALGTGAATAGDITVDADTLDASLGTGTTTLGDILVNADLGNATAGTLGALTSGRDFTTRSAQLASVLHDVTAARDYLVTGGTGVVLGDNLARTQKAARFTTIVATTGNVAQGAGLLTLQSDSDGTGTRGASDTLSVRALTGNVALGNSALLGGPAGQSDVLVGAAQSVTLGSVNGRSIGVRGVAGSVATGALVALEDIGARAGTTLGSTSASAGDDIDLTSVGNLSLTTGLTSGVGANASFVDLSSAQPAIGTPELADHTGADIRLTSTAGNVTAGTLDASAGRDVLVDAVIGNAGVTLANAGRDVGVHGGGSASLGTGIAGNSVTVDADTLDATLGVGTTTSGDILVNADAGNATAGTLGALTSGRDFTTRSAQLATVLHDVTAARDYLVTGGTGVVLGDGNARTQSAARFTTIVATTGNVAQGAGLLTLQSDRDGTGIRGASDTLSLRAATGNVTLGNSLLVGGTITTGPSFGRQSDVLVGAGGTVRLINVHGRSIGVRGIGDVQIDALNAVEDIAVRSGAKLTLGTADAGDDIDLTSVGLLTLTTRARTDALGADASSVDLSVGMPVVTTPTGPDGANIRLASTTGDVVAETLDAGLGVDVLVDAVIGNADVTSASAGRDIGVHGGGSASLGGGTAGRDIKVDATTLDATLGTGIAGRDIIVTAGRIASVRRNVTAGRDYLVTGGTGVVLGDDLARTQSAGRFATIVATTGDVIQGPPLTARPPLPGLLTLQSDSDGTGARAASETLSVRAIAGNVDLGNSLLVGGTIVTGPSLSYGRQSDVLVGAAQSVTLGGVNGRSIGIRGVAGFVTTGALAALEDIGARSGATLSVTRADAGDDIDLTSIGLLTLPTGATNSSGADTSSVDLTGAMPVVTTPTGPDGANIRLTSTTGNVIVTGTLDAALPGNDVLVDAVVGNASVALANAGRNIGIHGGGSASLGGGGAGNDITVDADNLDATLGTGTAGRNILVNADLANAKAGTAGPLTSTTGDIIVTANLVTTVQRDVTAARDYLVTGGTGVVLGGDQARTQSAGRFTTIVATTGDVIQGPPLIARPPLPGLLTLQSDRDGTGTRAASETLSISATTGNVDLGNSVLVGGTIVTGPPVSYGRQSDVLVNAGQSVTLGGVNGRSIGIRAAAGLVDAGALTAIEDIAASAGATLRVTTADAGDDIDLTSAGDLTLTTSAFTNAMGADASFVDLSGSLPVVTTTASDGANIRLTSTAGNVVATGATLDVVAGNDVLVDAVTGNADVMLARAGRDVGVHGGGRATLGTGIAGRDITVDADTLDALLGTGTAGRDILVNADLGNATAGTLGVLTSTTRDTIVRAAKVASVVHDVTAGRDYLVTGGTGVVLGNADPHVQSAGRYATIVATTGNVVQGGGLLTLQSDSDGTGTRTASETLSVRAIAGNVTLDNSLLVGGTIVAGPPLSYGRQSDVFVGAGSAVRLINVQGRSIGVHGGGNVQIDALTALEDIGVHSDAALTLGTADAGDDIDLISIGNLTLTTRARTDATGADASSVDPSGAMPVVTTPTVADGANIRLTSTTGNVIATGATLDALPGNDVLVDAVIGNADALLAKAGRDVGVHGGGSATLGTGLAATRDIKVDADRLNATLGTATAGRDIIVNANMGTATATTLDAGRDVSVNADALATVTSATAGGNIGVNANGNAGLGGGGAGGSISVTAGNNASLGTGEAGSFIAVLAGNDAGADIAEAGTTITVDADRGDATLGRGTAVSDILVNADMGNATAGTVGPLISTTRDITVTAAQVATVLNDVTAGRNYLVTGGTGVSLGDGSARTQKANGAVAVTATTGGIAKSTGALIIQSNADDSVERESLTLDAQGDYGIALGGATLLGGVYAPAELANVALLPVRPANASDVILRGKTGIAAGNIGGRALYTVGDATRLTSLGPIQFNNLRISQALAIETTGAGANLVLNDVKVGDLGDPLAPTSAARGLSLRTAGANADILLNGEPGAALLAEGDIVLASTRDIVMRKATSAVGKIDISAGRNLLAVGSATSSIATPTPELTLGSLLTGGLATLKADNSDIRIGNVRSTAGDIGVTATKGSVTGGGTLATAAMPTGGIDLDAKTTIDAVVAQQAQLGTLLARQGAPGRDAIIINAGALSLVNASGPGITIKAASAALGGVDAGSGSLSIGPISSLSLVSGTAGGDIGITADSAAINTLSAGRDISVTTANGLSLRTATAVRAATLTNTGGVATTTTSAPGVAGAIRVNELKGSTITIDALGDVRAGSLTATGTVDVDTNGSLTGLASGDTSDAVTGGTLVAAGSIGVSAKVAVQMQELSAGQNIGVTAGKISIGLANTNAAGAIDLEAGDGGTFLGSAAAGGAVTLRGGLGASRVASPLFVAAGSLLDTGYGSTRITAGANGSVLLDIAKTVSGTASTGSIGQLGIVTAGQNVTITAGTATANGGLAIGSATATAGTLALTANGGGLYLGGPSSAGTTATLTKTRGDPATTPASGNDLRITGNLTATGLISIDSFTNLAVAANQAVQSTAGAIQMKSNQIDLAGSATAATSIQLTNRDDGLTNLTGIGNFTGTGAPAMTAADYALDQGEIDRVNAPTVSIVSAQGAAPQDVVIGKLSLGGDAASAGTSRFAILANKGATISLYGRLDAGLQSGTASRTIQIGGDDTQPGADGTVPLSATTLAAKLVGFVQPTAGSGAAIDLSAQGLTLDLRANKIIFGQKNFASFNGTGDAAASTLVSQNNSGLYDPLRNSPQDIFYSGAPVYLKADKLIVRYSDPASTGGFALFQNTGTTGNFAGAEIGRSGGEGLALFLDGGGSLPQNAFALFGTINGRDKSSAALLPDAIVSFRTTTSGGTAVRISQANSRINGCLLGSDVGCLITNVTAPPLTVFDRQQFQLISTADDTGLYFNPLVGRGNEGLIVNIANIPVGIDTVECKAEDGNCPSTGASQ